MTSLTVWTLPLAILELLRLGIITGFRLRGPYWTWRQSTALGTDLARMPSQSERIRATLHYALWARSIRRMG